MDQSGGRRSLLLCVLSVDSFVITKNPRVGPNRKQVHVKAERFCDQSGEAAEKSEYKNNKSQRFRKKKHQDKHPEGGKLLAMLPGEVCFGSYMMEQFSGLTRPWGEDRIGNVKNNQREKPSSDFREMCVLSITAQTSEYGEIGKTYILFRKIYI